MKKYSWVAAKFLPSAVSNQDMILPDSDKTSEFPDRRKYLYSWNPDPKTVQEQKNLSAMVADAWNRAPAVEIHS